MEPLFLLTFNKVAMPATSIADLPPIIVLDGELGFLLVEGTPKTDQAKSGNF
jgi:hypothetical protein